MPGFDPFVLFRVLRHHTRIRSLHFVLGSLASCPDSIPSFCFGFSGITPGFNFFICFELSSIAPGFDPFLLFQVLRHRAQIQSLHLFRVIRHRARIRSFPFVSGSLASRPDSIPSFCFRFSGIELEFDPFIGFEFSGIAPKFDPFILFRVLLHLAQIRSLRFVSGSLALCPDSIPSFCFRFSGIVSEFLTFFGIVPGLYYLFRHRVWISLSSPTSCLNFPIFTGIISISLIFPGIVLGFLLVL